MGLGEGITSFFRRNSQFDAMRALRMNQDKAKIANIGSWPLVVLLPLKQQPWARRNGPISAPEFGDIWLGDLQAEDFAVRDKMDQSKVIARYLTLDELVAVWSVD